LSKSIKSGRLEATFMIAPLAMKLREQGVPVKILYLGHRDGSTVMVQKDSTAKSLRDLRGKTLAIPSKYSNQNLVIHQLMENQGIKPDEIRFVEMPPPDMPGALAAKAIDAYLLVNRTRRAPNSMARAACFITPKTSGPASSRACWW
jgi:NitT/TauT family transport system substrate-binding protein